MAYKDQNSLGIIAILHTYWVCKPFSGLLKPPIYQTEWPTKARAQLPHSYYFTTCILVLNFSNKGLFFEEIQDSHFLEKRGILVLTSINFEKKGFIFMSSVLLWKKGVHLGWKVSVLLQKKGFILDWKVFYHEKGVILSWKVSVLPQKGGHFQTGEQEGYYFFQWVREPGAIAVLESLLLH